MDLCGSEEIAEDSPVKEMLLLWSDNLKDPALLLQLLELCSHLSNSTGTLCWICPDASGAVYRWHCAVERATLSSKPVGFTFQVTSSLQL